MIIRSIKKVYPIVLCKDHMEKQIVFMAECVELIGLVSAPEIINYDPLSVATDMWSIGVITYIL